MSPKHTPEWRLERDPYFTSRFRIMAGDKVVAESLGLKDGKKAAAAPDLAEALALLLDSELLGHAGYCEACERHAPKNDRGLVGPISHAEGCPVAAARAALKKAGCL